MINKQSLWFVTLFSLIIILGIYYVSLPNQDIAALIESNDNSVEMIETTENDYIIAMKIEEEEKMLNEISSIQEIILNEKTTIDEKNDAYTKLQQLNSKKSKINEIETLIKNDFNIECAVKIDKNNITVILPTDDQGKSYANNIINAVQSLYKEQKYITVNFQK